MTDKPTVDTYGFLVEYENCKGAAAIHNGKHFEASPEWRNALLPSQLRHINKSDKLKKVYLEDTYNPFKK